MRILWIEQRHSALDYYDALQHALTQRGHNVTEFLPSSRSNLAASVAAQHDVALLGFGWMFGELPLTRTIRPLTPFSRAHCNASAPVPDATTSCLCGVLPFHVLLNKV